MREIVELAARIAELERRFSGMMRHGTVEEVDTSRHRVRLKFGADVEGKSFLSPWIPYAQMAGSLKVHLPPSVGQQFTLMAPAGDWQQAVAVPFTWSNRNPAPSESREENVLTFGDVSVMLRGGRLEISAAGVTLELTGNGLAITGGEVRHDGKNIGATHTHGGVVVGSQLTEYPGAE
ncbi:MAG: phage baseplate assembly protein V [Rhizobiales bacterium]|nr:phage baseplate assembly protein V [Hyphomicrobiales bacterium]